MTPDAEDYCRLTPGLPWLEALRAEGRHRFASLGLPTPRQEAWRFTNLGPLGRLPWRTAPPDSATVTPDVLPTVVPAGEAPSHRLVFVNGYWRPDLSSGDALPAGVVLTGLASALTGASNLTTLIEAHLGRLAALDGQALIALNTGLLASGALLVLPAGVALTRPVELVMIGAGSDRPLAWHPRVLVVAGAGSRATLVEHHLSLGDRDGCTNLVAELFLGAGARLGHYKVQRENLASFHLATVTGRLDRDARYEGFLLTTGARLSRNEVRLVLDGPGATATLNGAYLVRGRQHCDTTTLIDHARPGGTSRQMVKGVLDDEARAVFQGQVLVRPGAQQTDGHQLHRALLLSDLAQIDAKPELEIHADDVKCSHGATVGDLDDDALFYLRARGIDGDGARALLIAAFVNEAIAEITDPTVAVAFEALAGGWLTPG
jgi:Fe-S cluster assembly protein SufD